MPITNGKISHVRAIEQKIAELGGAKGPPGCDCDAAVARFSLTLSRAAVLSVRVTTRRGRLVRTLLDQELERGVVALTWDGKDGTGTQVTDRSYQVQVRFARGRWRAAPNAQIRVDTSPPAITADLPPNRIIAFGAAGDDGVYRYTVASNEPAKAWPTVFQVAADGTVDEVWRPDEPVALAAGKATELSWPAANRTAASPAEDGTYLVGYEVQDAAGNIVRSPPAFTPGDTGTAQPVQRARAGDHAVSQDPHLRRPGAGRAAAADRRPAGRPGRRAHGAARGRGAEGADPGRAVRPARVRLTHDGVGLAARRRARRHARRAADVHVAARRTRTTPPATASPTSRRPSRASTARSATVPGSALSELLRLAGPAMSAAGRSGAITDQRIEDEGIPKVDATAAGARHARLVARACATGCERSSHGAAASR